MIAALIAAVIAQPLDASYSTAQDSKNCGLNVSLRYPAEWVTAPSAHLIGLTDFSTPDQSVAMALWIKDRDPSFPAAAGKERALPEALWSVLQRFVPADCQYERVATTVMGPHPAAKISFRSAKLNGQVVGFIYERRVVMLWAMCQGSAAGRFDELKPTFQAVLESVSVQVEDPRNNFAIFASLGVVVVLVIGYAIHRFRSTSSASSPLSAGPPGRRR